MTLHTLRTPKALLHKTHTHKKKKNQKNGDRLVFLIQRFLSLFKPGLSTAQCQTHQNLFFFILPEGSRGGQLGASAPHPPLHGRSSCPGPAPTPRTNSKIHSAGFCQLPEFRNPPPQRCRGGGMEGGAAALPPPPTALTETLF